jgi:hypothetical protein
MQVSTCMWWTQVFSFWGGVDGDLFVCYLERGYQVATSLSWNMLKFIDLKAQKMCNFMFGPFFFHEAKSTLWPSSFLQFPSPFSFLPYIVFVHKCLQFFGHFIFSIFLPLFLLLVFFFILFVCIKCFHPWKQPTQEKGKECLYIEVWFVTIEVVSIIGYVPLFTHVKNYVLNC